MTLEQASKAVTGMCREAGLDVGKYVRMLEEFWAECPHLEAAIGYVLFEAANSGEVRL